MIGLLDLVIVIPVYNRQKGFDRCVKCAMAQEIPKDKFEIVIVDDCSDEQYSRMYQTYAKNNVKVVRLNERCGMGIARIEGLKHSNAKYCCFLDSDDHVDSDYYAGLLDAIKRDKNCSMTIGGIKDYFAGTDMSKIVFQPENGIIPASRFVSSFMRAGDRHCMVLWNKVWIRKLLVDLDLPKGATPCEEFGFLFPYKDRMTYARTVKRNSFYHWTYSTPQAINKKYTYYTKGIVDNIRKFMNRSDLQPRERACMRYSYRIAMETNRQYLKTHDKLPDC